MSREQLTEHESQQDAAVARPREQQQTPVLPPELHAQIMSLSRADSSALADLLGAHFSLTYQILAVASPHMGNAAVQRALAMLNKRGEADRPDHGLHSNEIVSMMEDSSDPAKAAPPVAQVQAAPAEQSQPSSSTSKQASATPETQKLEDATNLEGDEVSLPSALRKEVMALRTDDAEALASLLGAYPKKVISEILLLARQQGFSSSAITETLEIHKRQPASPETRSSTPVQKEPAAAEPPWVVEARKYNEAHSELANEFNQLTEGMCENDDTTKLDPRAIRDWQREHGLEADGKIGPKTLAAAREQKTTGSIVADAPQAAGEGIPV